mmetsp:Transcript_23636/g.55946  ORF Transcript_23636/g.55946 Transcript_23636/m.55946 type:complete len:392 (-) Transcript_23636:65-1240(-)
MTIPKKVKRTATATLFQRTLTTKIWKFWFWTSIFLSCGGYYYSSMMGFDQHPIIIGEIMTEDGRFRPSPIDNINICFITSQYSTSSEEADKIVNLTQQFPTLFQDPYLKFFAFTNLPDLFIDDADTTVVRSGNTTTTTTTSEEKDFSSTSSFQSSMGWNVIVKTDFGKSYKRFITQSRWPKFQGYKHPTIQQNCRVVFYMDANVVPLVDDPILYQKEARRVVESKTTKLVQKPHPTNPSVEYEFYRIRHWNKDTYDNTRASLKWIRSQPDFKSGNCQMYENSYFGYAIVPLANEGESAQSSQSSSSQPAVSSFITTSEFFWHHYEQEVDSWRDQPLWCYSLFHTKTHPLEISSNLFEVDLTRQGFGGHSYAKKNTKKAKAGGGGVGTAVVM